ncbi:hypothetical protein BMA721280_N0001, partial [Burkholderia mallei 2002721280]|jgi:hypothetical protein
MRPL